MNDVINQFTKWDRFWLCCLTIIATILMFYGWQLFWFFTDDAFIAFRYVSNSQLGYGYVWNAPPFQPVEGYTSFLWIVLLDIIWSLFDAEPPEAANLVSLIFATLTLFLGGLMILKIRWGIHLIRYRMLFLSLVLIGILTNRTFLVWSSSGLETAMFNFLFVAWIFSCLFLPLYSRKQFLGVTISASLLTLTRPDGLLISAVTLVLVTLGLLVKRGKSQINLADLMTATPLLLIPMHLVWRYQLYGEWLPNTYYAKAATGRNPIDSGFNYLLSFIIEYSLWFWLVIFILLVLRMARRISLISFQQFKAEIQSKFELCFIPTVVIVTILAHLTYYTFIIGGDHFEFRIYSYLIIPLFISFTWLVTQLNWNIYSSIALLVCFIVFSLPIPWIHWSASQAYTTREETAFLKISVADALQERLPNLPTPVYSYLRYYDSLQFELINHAIGMRHQEHKVFYEYLLDRLPGRSETIDMSTENYPLMLADSTGLVAWVYYKINIIDGFGLNDYVIARNPSLNPGKMMAHERRAPDGYLECFSQDFDKAQIVDVTAEKIIECEEIYWNWAKSPHLTPASFKID